MRLTERDFRLVNDIAFSHLLSRDQVKELHFDSITRTNTRLRELASLGLVQRLATPYFTQSLYTVGPKAKEILGPKIGQIVSGRTGSPRFLRHALCVTNARIALLKRGATAWRFELQVRCGFRHGGREWEIRPDGLAMFGSGVRAIEVDLGHVAPAKFKEKLRAYEAFTVSGEAAKRYKGSFAVLTITTGKLRARRLTGLLPPNAHFDFRCVTFEDLGLPQVGSWS